MELLTLKKLFNVFDRGELEREARLKPTSGYLRRLCFLYEWLTGQVLSLPDASSGAYVTVIDPKHQYAAAAPANYSRYRVRVNLPGTATFCPLVYRTQSIDDFMSRRLQRRAEDLVAKAPRGLIARAAAFLILSDSKASFAIEGESPPKDRVARWGAVVGAAGAVPLSKQYLVDLQRSLIGDDRHVKLGFREEGGFVGRHDALGRPEPEHISAKAEDLDDLVSGLVAFTTEARRSGFDPVLTAACVAFGFVYIHPFEDGNGRLHRFLMHHILADRRFTPPKLVFPISSVILDDIAGYRDVLETVSRPLLQWIDWRPTAKGNVNTTNDTADYYRYFDATPHCEYLFHCIERAVEKDLPDELAFLERRDAFHIEVTNLVDMGERKIDLLMRFLRQNQGTLSKRARATEFERLTDEEAAKIESLYSDLFA